MGFPSFFKAAVYSSALSADDVASSFSRGCCGLARELQTESIGCCVAGTFLSDGSCRQATACGAGQRMTAAGTHDSDRQCAPCPPGTFSNGNNAETCSPCTPGNFCPGGTAAQPCPEGTSNNAPRATTCPPCGAASHSDEGSTYCNGIRPGTYGVGGSDTNHTGVASCDPGFYCPGGATDRIACPPDTFAAGVGSAECEPMTVCMEGNYVRYLGIQSRDRTCGPCPDGQYAAEQNARVCRTLTVCRPGTFVTVGTESGQQDRVCQPCPPGTFSASSNVPECQAFTECPAGQLSSGLPSSSADRSCVPGGQDACTPGTQYQSDFDGVSRYCRDILPPCQTPIQYEIAAPTLTTNRICERTTSCDAVPGLVEATVPTATTDRVCQPLCSTCPAGSYETSPCNEAQSRPNTCAACTPCESTSFVSSPCTSSSDRVCLPRVDGLAGSAGINPGTLPKVEATIEGHLAVLPGRNGATYVGGALFMGAGGEVNVGETIVHLSNTVREMAADMAKSRAEADALRIALEQANARIEVLERPGSA